MITVAYLYQTLGHGTWVELRKLTGDPVDRTTAKAHDDRNAGHTFGDCIRMLACPVHGSRWRQHTAEYRAAHRKSHPLPPKKKG